MIINGRFHQWDFQVYYSAAADWLSGGEVYGKSYGLSSGFYKYSLTALIPFVPFTFLSYFWASSFYYFGLLFLVIKFIRKWSKWLRNKESYWSYIAVFWITLIFFGDHLERELFLGNINFLLLVLMSLVDFFTLVFGLTVAVARRSNAGLLALGLVLGLAAGLLAFGLAVGFLLGIINTPNKKK